MKLKIAQPARKTSSESLGMKAQAICAVDPGIGGTGVALWYPNELAPWETRVLTAPRKLAWWQKATYIAAEVADTCEHYGVLLVVCECPQFFASAGGEMVAGRGDLVKLSIAVGAIAGKVTVRYGSCFVPIEVNAWKGQLKKDVVNHRIRRTLGSAECINFESHAWDAVGLGLYARGDFE